MRAARRARTFPLIAGLSAVFASCGGPTDTPRPSSISVVVAVRAPFHPDMARFQIGSDPVLYELTSDDFTHPPYAIPATGEYPVPVTGSLDLRASLVTDGDTLASGTFTYQLQPGYDYGVQLNVGSIREDIINSFCYIDLVAVPVRRPEAITVAPGDTMFLIVFSRPPVTTPTCDTQRKLDQLDATVSLAALRVPPGNSSKP